jgi:hypothetical protein
MILLGGVVGAIATIVLLASTFDGYFAMINRNGGMIKWVAYIFDYQSAERYPNIDHARRVCFHDNGIISYESLDQHKHVVIEVKNIADN